MANRFLDTNFFKSPFVRSLKGELKSLYGFIICDCDGAGIWNYDIEIAGKYIGFAVTDEDFNKAFVTTGKAIKIGGGKYFFPDFIEHQYPSGLQENNKAHRSFINTLKKYNLIDENFKIKKQAPLEAPFKGDSGGQGNGLGNGQGNGNGLRGGKGEIKSEPSELGKEMIKIFKTYHTAFRENIHGDPMWCGEIAWMIADANGWERSSVTNGKLADVLAYWELAISTSIKEKYWATKTIKDLREPNEFQRLTQLINFNKNAGTFKQNSTHRGTDKPIAENKSGRGFSTL